MVPLNSAPPTRPIRDCLSGSKLENAELRRSVVELVLQIQALRDGAGTLGASDAARHRREVP
jgi:hypothetical protein